MAEEQKRIFISYRRDDESFAAGRLYDWLENTFPDQVFMDVEKGLTAGADFPRELDRMVSQCDTMLAIIGSKWLTVQDEQKRPRLHNPNDFVRIEIASALQRKKWVIPILIDTAVMPRADELPAPLKPIATKQAVRLTPMRFKSDFEGLMRELARVTGQDLQTLQDRQLYSARHLLSPDQIRKNDEIANWNRIKDTDDRKLLRDHWATYPGGIYEQAARTKCEALAWEELPEKPSVKPLQKFLTEFPNGELTREAQRLIDERQKWEQAAWRWSLPLYIGLLFAALIGVESFPQSFGRIKNSQEGFWLLVTLPAMVTAVIMSDRQPKRSQSNEEAARKKQKKSRRKK